MRKPTPRLALLLGAGVATGSLISAAIAVASIPSSNGTITACYKKPGGSNSSSFLSSMSTGTLRVIDAGTGQQCRSNETKLTWNQQGPKGDKGDAGATGAKGDKGDAGATGDKGDAGATGEPGIPGAPGVVGPKGDKGDNGATGAPGAPGLAGAKGDKGDPGAIGPQGPTGDKGDKGDTGPAGPQGVQGPQGAPGMANRNIATALPFTLGANGAVATLFATCLPGQVAVAGGMTTVGSSTLTVDVLDDGPDSSGTAWRLRVINRNIGIAGIGQVTIAAQAVCVDSL